MLLNGVEFDKVTESDLTKLIEIGYSETKTIEYKEQLPGSSDTNKKEFLKDVSSFTNASGGFLIYGMQENESTPVRLIGLDINRNQEILRLEEIIRNGVDPRIPGLRIREIPLENGKYAIILYIPRSFALPHMVKYQGSSRFYSRNSKGAYQLDVMEIRSLFLQSDTIAERIRRFRIERLSNIISNETPVRLNNVPKIVMHVIPLNAFDASIKYDTNLLIGDRSVNISSTNSTGINYRYNFDGFVTDPGTRTPEQRSYLQIYRNGIIESVNAYIINREVRGEDTRLINTQLLETTFIDALKNYLIILKRLGVESPIVVMMSIIGVRGYSIAKNPHSFSYDEIKPIDRNDLIVPDILVENFDADASQVLKPIFDSIWNAAGWPRCMNYDDNGIRIQR